MEEVRKKCVALKRRPRRKFLLLVRVCGPLVTTNLFQCKWGTLFERLGVCKCVLFALKEVLEHEQGVQKFDGPQKNKKKNKTHLESNTQTGTKECLRLRKVPGTGAFTSTGREATTSKGDVREKCARVCVCLCVLLRCVNKIVHLNGFA